jgi:multiple antibiotic resistance protein
MIRKRAGLSHENGQRRRICMQVLTALPLMMLVSSAAAQELMTGSEPGEAQSATFTFGKMFTFLFLTLGPLKLLGPFAKATHGEDAATKRSLAMKSILLAFFAVLVASTLGEKVLRKWNVSVGALLMTAGLILFLIALKPILEQFARPEAQETPAGGTRPPLISPMALAFPTIVTPYGVAILIVLMSLAENDTTAMQVLLVAVFILVLDLIAMLYAERILKTPLVAPTLGIVGTVLGVLQVALGVQAMFTALRLMGFPAHN